MIKYQISIQISKLGNVLNSNEISDEMLGGNPDGDDSYPDADPDAT